METFEVHNGNLIKKYFVFPAKPKHAGFQAHFDAFFEIFWTFLYVVLVVLYLLYILYDDSQFTLACIVVSFLAILDMCTSGTTL